MFQVSHGFTRRTHSEPLRPKDPLARAIPGPSRPESTLLLRRAIPATGVLPNADNVLHNAKSKAEGTNFEKHWGGLQGLSYLVASVRGNMVGCTASLAPTVRFGSDKTDVFQQVVLF